MRRACNGNDENTGRLQIVPWFNKDEWLDTYQQAYSDNVAVQEIAYTQMKVWKARNPNLPLGVECTMSMLHVKLCDKQMDSDKVTTLYQDRDLQLLYSTAVMRFLNHLTTMSKCKDSMYKMAEEHEIPDWLINLRHEAAHGNTVPALYLLRQAGDVIMQWLKKHYWEAEADIMEDVIKNQDNLEYHIENIKYLLQLWIHLQLSHWAGYRTIDNIPDDDIRKQAMDMANEEGCGIKRTNTQDKNNLNLKKKKQSVEQGVIDIGEEQTITYEDVADEYTHKIKTAFDPLLRRLLDPLKVKVHKRIKYEESLIECLVTHDGFCLHIQDLDEIGSSSLEVMSLQVELWKEVLKALQAHNLLHCLLKRLISYSEERPFAHLWLRLLTQMYCADPLPHPPGTLATCQLFAQIFPVSIQAEVLLHKANSLHVKRHKPLVLRPVSARECDVLQDWAQQVVYHPTRFTCTYLHSLLNFWKTPLTNDVKAKLCKIARLYSERQPNKTQSDQVYTLASLLDHGLVLSQAEMYVVDENEANECKTSVWTLYSGDADWGQCALGALPW